ncbi:MAG: 3-hydroxyacyl-CoA dehydrogenase NAD-binding domain-containing protein, partial [Rhodothermales bacterium]
MPESFLRIERSDDLLIWWLDQEGERHNKLSLKALDELGRAIDEARADSALGIVVMSAKQDSFVVGADVEMLRAVQNREEAEELSRRGHGLIRSLQSVGKPVVAAMHGPAMGGGLELALACTARIASTHPTTKFALPEVRLGLLPGGGGTQLLPRLVGLQQALPLLLTGKNVYPHPARRIGLVDAIIHAPGLLQAAQQMARELVRGIRPGARNRRTSLLESTFLARKIIYSAAAKQIARETRGNYPAPSRILDCVRTGMEEGMEAGFLAEERHFGDLAVTPESRELVRLFFAKNEAEKNPYRGARRVESVGILGAGLMGSGIAEVCAEHGIDVVVKDQSLELAARARRHVFRAFSARIRKKTLSGFERDMIVERIIPVENYDLFRRVDLVIEAAPEDVRLKMKLIEDVERYIPEQAIFASNTSSIPISELATASGRRLQVVGMHYFSPVPKMPLLEIISTEETPEWVLATVVDVGLRQGKTIIVVRDGPGFYTTRILALYMNEALQLLEDGADIRSVDKAMRDFGFPLGPFQLFDLVGIDVASKITGVLVDSFESRGIRPNGRAKDLVGAGLLGQKSAAGFYKYELKGDRAKMSEVNEAIYEWFGGSSRSELEEPAIQERLTLSMVNEAANCLHERILRSSQDGDVGAVFGLGFPPFLGGPFRYIENQG